MNVNMIESSRVALAPESKGIARELPRSDGHFGQFDQFDRLTTGRLTTGKLKVPTKPIRLRVVMLPLLQKLTSINVH
mgnify:CR=1 FL=1